MYCCKIGGCDFMNSSIWDTANPFSSDNRFYVYSTIPTTLIINSSLSLCSLSLSSNTQNFTQAAPITIILNGATLYLNNTCDVERMLYFFYNKK